jgi:hypothetical protein
MRSPSFHFKAPRLAAAVLVTIALCAVAIPAQAGLCVITGPDQLCAGQAVLCGPNGPYDYEWTGPGGFTAQTQCITVTVPGTYALRLFDFLNGLWVPPCSHDVAGGGDPAPCSIAGPNRACTGETVTLCGPAGAFTYGRL